jgi:hypothetical protein
MPAESGRPVGEIRRALLDALEDLTEERAKVGMPLPGATCREIAARACVGLKAARQTLDNMARSGAVLVVDRVQGDLGRPQNLYAPPPAISAHAELTSLHQVRSLTAT